MKKDNPFCPFCTDSITCVRHKEKGTKNEKKIYQIPKRSERKKANSNPEKERKERLKIFFEEKIQNRPERCQNCNFPLLDSMFPQPRTIIAHILCKRNFHSVETHDDNFIYLCSMCHNQMDLQNERFLKDSKLSGLIKERIQILIPLLTIDEVSKIPSYYL